MFYHVYNLEPFVIGACNWECRPNIISYTSPLHGYYYTYYYHYFSQTHIVITTIVNML